MFRRRWSGLPADPKFSSDLGELGYFINDADEIRSKEDPDCYFKFFLTKNERWNDRQRFHMNHAIGKVIESRLTDQGLGKVLLPLGQVRDESVPHVQIRVSRGVEKCSRVVIIFGEGTQEFGVLAHRVIGGPGGVDKGSVVGLVKALKSQEPPPRIIIANPGELFWWPEGKRSLSATARHAIPGSSAVHKGWRYDPDRNEIPTNRNIGQHVRSIFEQVVANLVCKDARIDVIAIEDTAEEVEKYLDKDHNWARFGKRLNSLVLLGGYYHSSHLKCEGFKAFLKERARAYIMHQDPLGTAVAGPNGNPSVPGFTTYGCPVFSAGPDAVLSETLLIEAQPSVLEWLQKVAAEGEDYKNPVVEIFGDPDTRSSVAADAKSSEEYEKMMAAMQSGW